MNAGNRSGGDESGGRANSIDMVELKDHDPAWAMMFQEERDRLASALGGMAVCIEHVGSTAVPGLKAKPVIDIMVGVRELSLDLFEGTLSDLGYVHVPIDEKGRLFFRKGMPRTHHLHLVLEGGEEYLKHTRFRDRLIDHPDEAREYQMLKEELAVRFREDREAYTDGKDDFIRKILAKTDMDR